jgi:hypothetical protein
MTTATTAATRQESYAVRQAAHDALCAAGDDGRALFAACREAEVGTAANDTWTTSHASALAYAAKSCAG